MFVLPFAWGAFAVASSDGLLERPEPRAPADPGIAFAGVQGRSAGAARGRSTNRIGFQVENSPFS